MGTVANDTVIVMGHQVTYGGLVTRWPGSMYVKQYSITDTIYSCLLHYLLTVRRYVSANHADLVSLSRSNHALRIHNNT